MRLLAQSMSPEPSRLLKNESWTAPAQFEFVRRYTCVRLTRARWVEDSFQPFVAEPTDFFSSLLEQYPLALNRAAIRKWMKLLAPGKPTACPRQRITL
jgi:hypothetical protein